VLIELWENANRGHAGACWILSLLTLQRILANISAVDGCLDAIYLCCFYAIGDLTSQDIFVTDLSQNAVLVVWYPSIRPSIHQKW